LSCGSVATTGAGAVAAGFGEEPAHAVNAAADAKAMSRLIMDLPGRMVSRGPSIKKAPSFWGLGLEKADFR
jgi:hypothetical protein